VRLVGPRGALLLVLLLAACRPGAPAPVVVEQGAFAVLVAGDTTVVDEYRRTAADLHGTLRLFSREPGGATARAVYHVTYAPEGHALSARLVIAQVSPAGVVEREPREWSATFDPSGRVTEVETPGGRRSQASPGRDALPLFGPSVAMLESIFLEARAASVSSVPVFHLAAAARVDTLSVRWSGPDSVHVTIAGATGAYQLDRSGRILGGAVAGDELRTVRLR
jgi:hypothetical protein